MNSNSFTCGGGRSRADRTRHDISHTKVVIRITCKLIYRSPTDRSRTIGDMVNNDGTDIQKACKWPRNYRHNSSTENLYLTPSWDAHLSGTSPRNLLQNLLRRQILHLHRRSRRHLHRNHQVLHQVGNPVCGVSFKCKCLILFTYASQTTYQRQCHSASS